MRREVGRVELVRLELDLLSVLRHVIELRHPCKSLPRPSVHFVREIFLQGNASHGIAPDQGHALSMIRRLEMRRYESRDSRSASHRFIATGYVRSVRSDACHSDSISHVTSSDAGF